MAVRARKVLRPKRALPAPVGIVASRIAVIPARRIHQARKRPFCLFLDSRAAAESIPAGIQCLDIRGTDAAACDRARKPYRETPAAQPKNHKLSRNFMGVRLAPTISPENTALPTTLLRFVEPSDLSRSSNKLPPRSQTAAPRSRNKRSGSLSRLPEFRPKAAQSPAKRTSPPSGCR